MQVKAIKPCFYGKGREPGEVFETTGQYGYMLIRMGSAVEVSAGKDMKAEDSGEESPKRTYKRKDMKAEGDTK